MWLYIVFMVGKTHGGPHYLAIKPTTVKSSQVTTVDYAKKHVVTWGENPWKLSIKYWLLCVEVSDVEEGQLKALVFLLVNSIWRWRSWSTLVQVMACCLMAPSHYLNQCWLIINKVLWHSSEDIIIKSFEDTNQLSKIEDYILKITLRSPTGQWLNVL